MFLGHIGEKHVESVVDVFPGDNFGWSEREGPFVFKRGGDPCLLFPLPPDDAKFGFVYPLIVWDHNRLPDIPCSADRSTVSRSRCSTPSRRSRCGAGCLRASGCTPATISATTG